MHFRKLILRSVSMLCVLMLLVSVTPSAHAAVTGTLSNSSIILSAVDNEGGKQGTTNTASMEATWTADGTTIEGSVTPGSTYFARGDEYYPDTEANSILTLTNNLGTEGDEAILSFAYTDPTGGGSISFSENAVVDGNMVSATLLYGESVQITLTTAAVPIECVGKDNRTEYTATTTITGLDLVAADAGVKITLKAIAGGSYTVSDGVETKTMGDSFTNPVDTPYTLTAAQPEGNYHFSGWAFNGVKQSVTSMTLTGVKFNTDTTVEALYTLDPMFAVASSVGNAYVNDLVGFNSRYYHQTRNEKVSSELSSNSTDCYYGVENKSTPGISSTQYIPSLEWGESGTSVTVTKNGSASGQYEKFGTSHAWANMVTDVIRIYGKQDSIVSFDYSFTCSGADENTPNLHVYVSTSGTETIANIKSKGTAYGTGTTTVTTTLPKDSYMYIYADGYYHSQHKLAVGWSCSFNYKFTSTISNVKVQANDTRYIQTTTFKDNAGNGLASGKLAINGVSYAAGENGVVTIPSVPDGQNLALSVATVPTNYRLMGWEVDGVMHYTPTYTYDIKANTVVNPVFVPNQVTYDAAAGTYQYKNISNQMVDLNGQYVARNAAATVYYKSLAEGFAADGEVVLLGNMTINNDFEIPAGEVLVVPCAMVDVIATDSSGDYIPPITKGGSGVYATLTVNGNMTVNGDLIVGGQQATSGGARAGSYGVMSISAGKTITVSGNSSLYGYGLVKGLGGIQAKSNAHVHELCEIKDFPHPYVTEMLNTNAKTYRIMPFNSYYMNTIEAKTTYEGGATLEGHWSISYDYTSQESFPVIGASEGILLVKGGTVTKYFDSSAKQIVFRVNEGATVESGSFTTTVKASLSGIERTATVDSNKFFLPLSAGYQFITAGDLTMKHDFKMLPGAKVHVTSSGELTIAGGADLVLYRLNDYDYRKNSSTNDEPLGFSAVGYPASMTGYSISRASIGSAKLQVDGKVIVNGGLYVTDQLIPEHTETDTALAFKNYSHYDNGYNYLTGVGTIDVSAAENSLSEINEHQINNQDKANVNITEIAVSPIKGLKEDATADEADQYAALTDVSMGIYNDNGFNVWVADPCAAGHNLTETAAVPATCLDFGTKAYWSCDGCGGYFSDDAGTTEIVNLDEWLADETENGGKIAALGHTYGDTEYNWAEDYTTCSAVRTCTVEGCAAETDGYSETAPATVTSELTTAATCKAVGVRTHTATFAETVDWAEKQIKTEEIAVDENAHDWDTVTYVWTDDGTSCTATRVCKLDNTHKETADSTAVHGAVKTAPTCTTKGWTTYTAAFDVDWAANAPVKEVQDIESNPDAHAWANACDTTCENGCGTTRDVSHNYTSQVTTAATCESAGVKTFTCSACGDTYTEAIDALGHDMQETETVSATCKEEGYIKFECANGCGKTETTVTGAAIGCSYVSVVTPPTCTEKGYTTHTCSVCGGSYKDSEVAAKGHTPGAAATCTTAQTCTVCNAVLNAATGNHNYTVASEEVVTAANCVTEAVYKAKCSVCGDVSKTATIVGEKDGTKHTGVNHTDGYKAADCENAGYTGDTVCECGTTVKNGEEIPALGHKYTNYESNHDATCTADGTKTASCDNGCGKKSTIADTGSMLGHDWAETTYIWSDDGKSCTAKHVCKRDASHVETATATAEGKITTPATCTVMGTTTYTAAFEGDWAVEQTTTRQDVPVIAHNYNQQVATDAYKATDATCVAKATYYKSCVCGQAHETDVFEHGDVDASAHVKIVDVPAVAATCTSTGLTAGKQCESCRVFTVPQTETDMLEHSYSWKTTTEATCVATGVETGTCSCGATTTRDIQIAPDAHDLKTVAAQDATCTQIGWAEYVYCQRNGCSYNTYNRTEKLDHDFSDEYLSDANGHWHKCKNCTTTTEVVGHTAETIPGRAATHGEPGLTDGEKCSVCEYVIKEQEDISALGHGFGEPVFTWNDYECTAKLVCVCGVEEDLDCTVSSAITTTATCVVEGVETYTAKAIHDARSYESTKTKNLGLNADNHADPQDVAEIPATCIATGTTAGVVCNSCGTVVEGCTEIKIDADNHKNTESKDAVAATCTEVGYTEGVYCNDCKKYVSGHAEIPKIDHKNAKTINAKEATCTVEGYTGDLYCDDCKTTIQKGETIKVKPHTAVHHEAVGKTCTTDGSIEYWTCSVCSKYFSDAACTVEITAADTIVAKGHELTFVDAKAATCTESGNIAYYDCADCDKYFEDENAVTELTKAQWTIAALNHNWGAWETTTAPKCEEDGEERRDCTGCDAFETNVLTAIDHSWNNGEVTTNPTCSAEGVKTFTCLNDNAHTKTEPIAIAPDAHDWNEGEVTTDPTCTEAGVKTYTCQNDKTHTKTETVSALNHEMVDVDGKAATCTEDGYTAHRDCVLCEYTEGKEIIPAAHTLTKVEYKAPSCTEAGHNAYSYCTVCDYTTYSEIAAKGHKPGAAADCENAQTCTVCDAVLEAAKGHKPGAAADCENAQTCTVCNAVLEAAKGHKPGAAADCENAQTCTVCNAVLEAALGHKPGAAANCTTAQICTVCKAELAAATGHLNTEYHEQVDATYESVGYTAGTYCVDCETWISGHEEIPMLTGYAVTLDDRFVISKGTATTTLDSSKRYAPGQSFTVTSAKACVVAISYDNGNSYEELSCTLVEGNTYRFTIPEEVDSDFTIGIVLKGDANENGATNIEDATRIARFSTRGIKGNNTLDSLTKIASDANCNGSTNIEDATRVARYSTRGIKGNNTLEWAIIPS